MQWGKAIGEPYTGNPYVRFDEGTEVVRPPPTLRGWGFFEKDETDKNGKSIGRKIFTLGATAALIVLTAFAATAGAQGDDYSYFLNPMAADSLEDMMSPSPGNNYAPGSPMDIYVAASKDYGQPVTVTLHGPGGTLYTINAGIVDGITKTIAFDLPSDAPDGSYQIRANGIGTDSFTVDTAIPEFPTVAIPVVAIMGLLFLLRRGGSKKYDK